MLRMPGAGSCRRGGCAAGLKRSSGGSATEVAVWLGSGCLVVEAAEEVEIQLDRRSLLVRVAVEVQSGGGGGLVDASCH